MRKKIAGKLNQPPAQAEFDRLPLADFCRQVDGVFYRLHAPDPATGEPWPPLHFSRRGNSRFDPKVGVAALCVAEKLPGALMELFDDHWGAVGSLGRSVAEQTLTQTWVTRVDVPSVSFSMRLDQIFPRSAPMRNCSPENILRHANGRRE
jgi:hypothetical protein